MSGGDPDAQCRGANGEPQRWAQVHRLAVDARVHGCGGVDLQERGAPGSPRGILPVVWFVENQYPQQAAIKGWAAAQWRTVQHVGVVRHQHDYDLIMLTPSIVDEVRLGRLPTGT